ncbi:glycoside hydrolase family 3 protein [Kitasatospora herbaricolor]|uniref:Glycoside hydrolase family 3 C-terminal domain-containing protein n=1 Tax=Kitasatospora herbaricolor TaxID=68217 RepID=A0ABZ1WI47_9ACTN|nr:glycoside hydrolase family 3 C-terminal domain-containing protein [Kitasatospora herbaricolor]
MNRRTFLTTAVLTSLATTVVPAVAASGRGAVTSASTPQSRASQLLAVMTPAQKEALVRCDFAALASLGIPSLTMADASAGLRGETGVTAFPVPVAQAATFDAERAGSLGAALGAEGRAKGYNNLLAPTVDIARHWRSGRQAEGMGEDPYLAGTLAANLTARMQQQGVVATVKHFAAYTQETDRTSVNVTVSDRALHEIYQAPVRRVVATTPLTSVMMSYPKVNGTFAVQNAALFADLKATIGLQGYTVPDFWAGDDQVAAARAGMDLAGLGPGAVQIPAGSLTSGISAARLDDAARRILTTMIAAGLFDNPLPTPSAIVSTRANRDLAHDLAVHGTVLLQNRNSVLPLAGSASVAVIGPAGADAITGVSGSTYVDPGSWTTPLQAIRNRAGSTTVTHTQGSLGDIPLTPVPSGVLRTAAGAAGLTVTYYAGAQATGTPVATETVAGIDFAQAPLASLPPVWSARYTGRLTPTSTGLHRFSLLPSGTASLTVNGSTVVSGTRHMWRFFLGPFDYPLQGTTTLTAGSTVDIEVVYTNATAQYGQVGLTLGWQPDSLIPAAVAAARAADTVVVLANRIAGEDMDHGGLDLPGDQNQLIAAVAAANPRTVVVLNTDGPVAMPWLGSVAAVVQSWYGGQAMGTALAAVLFGDSDPAGRLPVTFPAAPAQGPGSTPATYPGDGTTVAYTEDIAVGYRYYDRNGQSPLFPFGHGLSYTSFALGDLTTSYDASAKLLTATVNVTNSGTRTGWSVVQLYAALPASANAEPRRLVGFRKLQLAPKASTRVTFTVPAEDLSVWQSGAWALVPGLYTVHAGRSSRDLAAQRALTIS